MYPYELPPEVRVCRRIRRHRGVEAGLASFLLLIARSKRSAKLSSNIGARSMGAETGRYLQHPKEIEETMAAAEKLWSWASACRFSTLFMVKYSTSSYTVVCNRIL